MIWVQKGEKNKQSEYLPMTCKTLNEFIRIKYEETLNYYYQ